MTLKEGLEKYLNRWYEYTSDGNDGIKCYEYEENGPYKSLFDRRIIKWSVIKNLVSVGNKEIIARADIELAKRLLINIEN